MSETAALATPAEATAPAPTTATPPAGAPPASPPAAPATTPSDPFDAGADKFDRPYVEKLRNEAAERRVALKKYEDAFGQYDPDAQEVWMNLAKITAQDPAKGAEALEEVVKLIREGLTPSQAEAVVAAEGADKPLTRAELETYFQERQLEAQTTAESVRIQAEAEAAGYKPGTPDYEALMLMALNHTNLDLGEAIKQMKAREQAIIDKWVAERVAAGEKWPTTAPAMGAVPDSNQTSIKGLEDSKKSLMARLKATAGQ